MKAIKQSFQVAFKVSNRTILRNNWCYGVQKTPRHPAVLNPVDNWHLYLS